VLQELHVEIASREGYLGNIYKGRVVNIEPSIGAAFVTFGGTTNGFLHASDVLPDYAREDFKLTDVLEGRARATVDEGPDVVRAVLADDDDEDADDGGAADSGVEGDGEGSEGGGNLRVVDERSQAGDGDGPGGEDLPAVAEDGAPDESEAEPADGGEADGGTEQNGSAAQDVGAVAAVVRTRRTRRRERPQEKRGKARVPIDRLLRKGQEVVVQITKEGIGNKGPTLTTYISLPGRYLVLMPSLPKCGVSRKIDGHKERRRLKKIVDELDETGKGGIGFIVRTAGTGKTKDDLERDRDYLKRIWELVTQRVKLTRAPALLYEESDLVLKAMRDLFTPDIHEVVVDSKDVHVRIRDFADKLMPQMADRIRLHEAPTPLFHSYGIEPEVEGLFQPRVELANGAYVIIDQTEALVSIDVNSGRFKPGSDLEETAYKTNLMAIPEIVRQLRLRDLGGLIIVDFIDMQTEKHRKAIERKLYEALRGDRARIKVGRISAFGLLELTRQRVGPGLKRTVFTSCSHCRATGLVRTVQSKGLGVLRDVRALLPLKGFSVLQVFCSPQVNDFLVNYKRRQILDLEEVVGKSVIFRSEPTYPVDAVHYRFLTGDGQEARVAVPPGLGVKL
jgi:ribonuclease E